MFMRSSTTSSTPMRPSSSMVVVMSCRWGMLPTFTGPSASRVAASIGNAAFLAPEMRISPSRGVPPVMMSLSIRGGPEVLAERRGSKRRPRRPGPPQAQFPSPCKVGPGREGRGRGVRRRRHGACTHGAKVRATPRHRPICSH